MTNVSFRDLSLSLSHCRRMKNFWGEKERKKVQSILDIFMCTSDTVNNIRSVEDVLKFVDTFDVAKLLDEHCNR